MRNFLLLLLLIAVLALVGFLVFRVIPGVPTERQTLTIHGTQFIVDVVRSPIAQARGLSGRPALTSNTGMLFSFDEPQQIGFWMKDMLFPIDIIWIVNNHVIDFVERAAPDDRPERTIYYPSAPVDAVLEVLSGTVAHVGIQVGDEVRF